MHFNFFFLLLSCPVGRDWQKVIEMHSSSKEKRESHLQLQGVKYNTPVSLPHSSESKSCLSSILDLIPDVAAYVVTNVNTNLFTLQHCKKHSIFGC